MKKEVLKTYISVALTALALVFSLTAFFTMNGTVAWFASNRDAHATEMQINLSDAHNKIKQVEYFAISDVRLDAVAKTNVYNFSATPLAGSPQLGTLSQLEAKRQLLVKLTLQDNVDEVSVQVKSETADYLLDPMPAYLLKDNNPLSSVIQFRVYRNVTASGDMYTVREDDAAPVRFVDIQTAGTAVTRTYVANAPLYTTPAGERDTAVYILLDYYEVATDDIRDALPGLAAADGSDIVIGETDIQFSCDFYFEIA